MSLPKYSECKDSGVPWLGIVPSHWGVQRFKWLIDRNDGGVWGEDADGIDDTLVLRSTEQTVDGHWRIDEPAKRKLIEKDRLVSLLVLGDLLVTKSSGSSLHIGKTTLVDETVAGLGACYSNFMQRLRVGKKLSPKIAWYILNSDLARAQFDLLSNSTTGLANLNGTIIGELILAIPPEVEQTTITAFLDRETAKIDALIAEQEKLIALMVEKRQATISQAVTRGLNSDVPMKDSCVAWLGAVPEHWSVVPLKYLVTLKSGGTPSKDNLAYWDGDIPWASAKDLKVERLADTTDHITEYAVESGAATLVQRGAILVVVRGMILARTFPVVETLMPMAINQDLKAIIPYENLSTSFLGWLLRGSSNESLQRLDEAGHGTKALRMDAWTSMQLPIPPVTEQADIAKFIEQEVAKLNCLKAEAERAIGLLNERRAALISAAVTGQIDVRGVVAQYEAPTDTMAA
jgi:type I restriction enzyme S subunit